VLQSSSEQKGCPGHNYNRHNLRFQGVQEYGGEVFDLCEGEACHFLDAVRLAHIEPRGVHLYQYLGRLGDALFVPNWCHSCLCACHWHRLPLPTVCPVSEEPHRKTD
jgi:hypothetical protein